MELFLGPVIILGIGAILIYALVWYMYKHIIKPDFDKYREEQNQRHEEMKKLMNKLIDSQKTYV